MPEIKERKKRVLTNTAKGKFEAFIRTLDESECDYFFETAKQALTNTATATLSNYEKGKVESILAKLNPAV